MADFIEASFWVMLPHDQVRKLGKDLRLSPLAVKDEGEKRRPHVLMDHTWFGVNEHTVMELPPKVMQFGGGHCLASSGYFTMQTLMKVLCFWQSLIYQMDSITSFWWSRMMHRGSLC
jgi:hypothetical protein